MSRRSSLVQQRFQRARFTDSPNDSPPSPLRFVTASSLAVLLSLAVNWAIARLGMHATSLRHYSHFQFTDYGTLSIIGVGAACAGWYVTVRVSDAPRWLFLQLAVGVSVGMLAPDVWLLAKGEPLAGVGLLVAMHVAMALITYNTLVHVAATTTPGSSSTTRSLDARDANSASLPRERGFPVVGRRAWSIMMILTLAELLLGFAEMLSVSFDRPNGFVVPQGEAVTLVHGALGSVLGFAGLVVLLFSWHQGRIEKIAGIVGAIGLGIGGIGGLLCYAHNWRLVGMVVMFVGASTAFFGYLMPTIDDAPNPSLSPFG